MIYLDKIKGAGTCSSCSNQAEYKINMGNTVINLCSKCSEYIVNRLRNLSEVPVLEAEADKSYKRDVYKSNFKHWSEEEIEFLKVTDLTPREISELLSRTVAAVRRKLSILEIKPNL
ncbi:MAG: hypothetical protein ACRC6U_09120 [Fusobacteriaceae bacterium]